MSTFEPTVMGPLVVVDTGALLQAAINKVRMIANKNGMNLVFRMKSPREFSLLSSHFHCRRSANEFKTPVLRRRRLMGHNAQQMVIVLIGAVVIYLAVWVIAGVYRHLQ